jgi:hypothetical protein
MIPRMRRDYFANSINHLIFVMKKCYVVAEVRSDFLNYLDDIRASRNQTLVTALWCFLLELDCNILQQVGFLLNVGVRKLPVDGFC